MAVFPIANDLNLVKERDNLSKIFPPSSAIDFRDNSQATFQIISHKFNDHEVLSRATVFHYGGHADGKNIEFCDAEGDMEGFCQQLAALPYLQLVFINGCDSFKQAKLILRQKDIAVIVTQGKIRDDVAMYFAEQFYTIWACNFTIQYAFDKALSNVITTFGAGNGYTSANKRGVKITKSNDDSGSAYYLFGNKEKLQENMREKFSGPLTNNTFIDYNPSYELVTTISNSILQSNDPLDENIIDFRRTLDKFLNDPNELTYFVDLKEAILKLMPYPIGYHLSLLWSAGKDADENQEYDKLLRTQISTYAASLQLLSFSMLNCLLDELLKSLTIAEPKEELSITEIRLHVKRKQLDLLYDFIHSNDADNMLKNSPLLLITIREIFAQNREKGIAPFIEEYSSLQEVFVNETDFKLTHQYILGLRESLKNGQIQQKNIKDECKKMESTLSRIFEKAGFLAKYNLMSIREISIRKTRLEAVEFEIYRTNLVHSSINKYTPKNNGIYTDTHSVIFSRKTAAMGITTYLSLSPFVIDENGIMSETIPNILFFSHKDGDDYVFRRSNNPDNTRIVRTKNTFVKNDFTDKSQTHIDIINFRMTAITKELKYFEKLLSALKHLILN